MIICKKAQLEDLELLAFSIARINGSNVMTRPEMMEYLDHMYYLYNTDFRMIVGIIYGRREVRREDVFDPLQSVMISTKHYDIKCIDYLEGSDEDIINLVREFLADKNDFPTFYKVNETDEKIIKALRSNDFKYLPGSKTYMRIPIPNTSMVRFN